MLGLISHCHTEVTQPESRRLGFEHIQDICSPVEMLSVIAPCADKLVGAERTAQDVFVVIGAYRLRVLLEDCGLSGSERKYVAHQKGAVAPRSCETFCSRHGRV